MDEKGAHPGKLSFIVRHRKLVLVIGVVLLLGSAGIAPFISMNPDPTAYLPQEREDVAFFLALNKRFGALDVLMVGLEEPREPLSIEGLRAVTEVTKALEQAKAEGVLSVRSIANLETLTADEEGTLHSALLMEKPPATEQERKELELRIRNDPNAIGSLISKDMMGYVVLVKAQPNKDARKVASLVEKVVEEKKGDLKAFYFGGPFIANITTSKVYSKTVWLALFFLVFLFVLPAMLLKRLSVVLTVLFCSGSTLVFYLGFLRITGVRPTAQDINALLVLLGISVTFFASCLGGASFHQILPKQATVLLVGFALLLSFNLVSRLLPFHLPYLARFFNLVSLGFPSLLLSYYLLFVPLVSYSGSFSLPPLHIQVRSSILYIVILLVLSASAFAFFRFRFAVSIPELFSKDDEANKGLAFFDRRFSGHDFIQISFRGDLKEPDTARALLALSQLFQGIEGISDVRSVAEILAFLGLKFGSNYTIPEDRQSLQNLWFFLEGNDDIKALVTPSRDEAMITLRLEKDADLGEVMRGIEQSIRTLKGDKRNLNAKRLEAVLLRHGVRKDQQEIEQVVARMQGAKEAEIEAGLMEDYKNRLLDFLLSPEFPIELEESKAKAVLDAFVSSEGGADADIFSDIEPDEALRKRALEALKKEALAIKTALLAEKAASMLVGDKTKTSAFEATKGILTDILKNSAYDVSTPVITVSGFPVVASNLKKDLRIGFFRTIAFMWLLGLVLMWVARGFSLLSFLQVFAVSVLPSALTCLFSIYTDAGSSTLLLLSPILLALLSASPIEGSRPVLAFGIGLVLAVSSLVLTSSLPVIRIGVSLGLCIFSSLFVWLTMLPVTTGNIRRA